MKVLFYLEPTLFRDDPSMLLPWAGWVARIASANSELELSCASNGILVERLRSFSPVTCHGLTQGAVAGAFGFDRTKYAQDLYAAESTQPANITLLSALEELGRQTRPDLVVSFSQNRYLARAFGIPVLFSEMGPLPRGSCRPSLFFDPVGHQRPNLLTYRENLALRQGLSSDSTKQLLGLYESGVVIPNLADARTARLKDFLSSKRGGAKLALFAMQPPGWLTYEGLYPALAPADLVMSWAARLPSRWKGVVSYHPGHRLPAAVEQLITAEHDNVIFLPEELACGHSEQVLPNVDAVVTISSTMALQGALLGKRLVCAENSAWNGMAAHRVEELDLAHPLSESERASLLLFLTNRYCHPFERVLDEHGYFTSFVRALADGGFSPDLYFDRSAWSAESARHLLSLGAQP